jgi:hypothetical protein
MESPQYFEAFFSFLLLLFGIWTLIQSYLILKKGLHVFDIAVYIRLFIMVPFFGRLRTKVYKDKLIFQKNWTRFGQIRGVLGFIMVVVSISFIIYFLT